MAFSRYETNDSISDYFRNLRDLLFTMPHMMSNMTAEGFARWFDKLVYYDRRSMFLYLMLTDVLPPKDARAYICYRLRNVRGIEKLRAKYGLSQEDPYVKRR